MKRGHTHKLYSKLAYRTLQFERLMPREMFAVDLQVDSSTNLASQLGIADTRGAKVQQILFGSSTSPLSTPFRTGVAAQVGQNQSQAYPWSKIDTISIVFDENVQIISSQLQLVGQNIPGINLFNYDAQTAKAFWQFSAPLSSGKYLLTLSDRVIDLSGNRLDGEWRDGASQVSGNGLPGGEFNFRFDVHIGDVDSDGEVSVRDLAIVEANFGANGDLKFDVNMSGATDTDDSVEVSSVLGDTLTLGAPNETLIVKSLYSTSNANPSYAVVGVDQQGNSTLSVINANDGKTVSTRILNADYRYLELEPVNRNGNLESIVVLGVHRANGDVRLWFHSPTLSGAIPTMSLGKNLIPLDLDVVYSSTQIPRVAVLGTQNSKPNANRIWLVDPMTRQSAGSISLGTNFEAQRFVITPATGSTPAMFSVVGVLPSNKTIRIKTFNASTGALFSNFQFSGKNSILDLKPSFDPIKNESLVVALSSPSSGLAEVEVRTLHGVLRRKHSLQIEGAATSLAVWTQSTATEVQYALLSQVGPQRASFVMTGELLTAQIPRKISFGSGFSNVGILALARADAEDVAISVVQASVDLGAAHIKLRSARTGNSLRTIPTKAYVRTTDFFDQNRVHAHTPFMEVDERKGLARSWFQTTASQNGAALLSDMGAKVFARHLKTGDEDPWWPSEFPSDGSGTSIYSQARNNQGIALEAGQNLPQSYINEAIANNTPMIGYYFDATEQGLAVSHPEWVCKAFDGVPLTPHPTKGAYLDITDAYGEVVKNRLLEIANMGASGVYLDFRHLPAGGCWGTQLARDFQSTYGIPAPRIGSGPDYVKFLQFQADRLTQTLQGWKDAVTAQYPYFHFVISVTSVPGLTRIEMGSDLAAIDSPKSEFKLAIQPGQSNSVFVSNPTLYEPDADIRMAFGWTLLREVASNSLPHIWNALTPNRDQSLSFVSAVNTYGMIASVHIVEELLQPGGQVAGIASREDLIAALDLGNKISSHIAGTEPTKWMAVHFAENARDSQGTNARLAWENVLLPAVAAFQAGIESGRPVSVVNDDILTAGIPDEFRVLYLPSSATLTAVQLANVNAFKNRGGVVIANDGLTQWGQAASYRSGVNQISSTIASISAPIEFRGLPPRVHAVAHSQRNASTDGRIVLALANDFSYVQGSTIFEPIAANLVNPTPPPVPAGIRAVLELSDWPQLTKPNTEIIAVDALTLARIPVIRTSTTIEIVFPEFAQTSWVVIESIPVSAPLSSARPASMQRTNTSLPQDVNADGHVSPIDALIVINALNASRSVLTGSGEGEINAFFDVNGDSHLTPLDALLVINFLNRFRSANAEGESARSLQTPLVQPSEWSTSRESAKSANADSEVFAMPFVRVAGAYSYDTLRLSTGGPSDAALTDLAFDPDEAEVEELFAPISKSKCKAAFSA